MKLNRSTLILCTQLIASAMLALTAVSAQAQGYASRTQQIKAGVAILDSNYATVGFVNKLPSNSNPFIWLNLDRNTRVKPANWDVMNPLAPSAVTGEIQLRWGPSPGLGTTTLTLNSRIDKINAPYWEVFIDKMTDEELAKYDVLQLSVYDKLVMNPIERERLRRFVDGGGVLWVDLISTTTIEPTNNLPITVVSQTLGSNPQINQFHPILNSPYYISLAAVEAMQIVGNLSLRAFKPSDNTLGVAEPAASLPQEFNSLEKVYWDQNGGDLGAIIGVASIGDGFMVTTSRGVARAMNQVRTGIGNYNDNTDYTAQLVAGNETYSYDRLGDAVTKFAVNMISLPNHYGQSSGNSHKSRGLSLDLNAPLIRKFTEKPVFTNFKADHPPVIHKGLVAVVGDIGTGNRIFVYDTDPANDLDHDGNPDDGYADYNDGVGRDLVWYSAPIIGSVSSPVFVDNPSKNDAIVVSTQDGSLLFYNAFPTSGFQDVAVAASINISPGVASIPIANPVAPTVHNGIVFAVDVEGNLSGSGRVWLVDPFSNPSLPTPTPVLLNGGWHVSSSRVARITNSASVAEIPTGDNSGGFDTIVCVPTASNTAGPGIATLWWSTKGEVPAMSFNLLEMILTTRAAAKQLTIYNPVPFSNDRFAPRLTLVDSNGKMFDPGTGENYVQKYVQDAIPGGVGGQVKYNLKSALPADLTARLDYTIDWGNNNNQLGATVRGIVRFPDESKNRVVIGSPAISKSGKIFVSVGDPNTNGGGLYALEEQLPGKFRLVYRYELYNNHTISLQGASSVSYAGTFFDKDPIKGLDTSGLLNAPLSSLKLVGAPAISGDTVYVTAQAAKSGVVNCTILLALKADPEFPQIRVGNVGADITLVQPDFGASTSKAAPATFATQRPGQFEYNADTGLVTFSNMMTSTADTVANGFSASQPIILRRPGYPDKLIQPELSGGRWSPLLWYTVYQGMGMSSTQLSSQQDYINGASSPLVAGDSVFVCGSSYLPDLLINGAANNATAMVNAVHGYISPNDKFLHPTLPERSWMNQLDVLQVLGGGLIQANDNFLWPQGTGLKLTETESEFTTRLLQTTFPEVNEAYGIVGGDGSLALWGGNLTSGLSGLTVFSRADFIVADEGRIARFDSSGNPLWSTDQLSKTGNQMDVGNSSGVSPVVKVVRAYPLGKSEMLVVDAGANRVMRLDESGRIVRNIEEFKLDPGYVPDGYRAGESLNLKDPSDVAIYTSFVDNTPVVTPKPNPLVNPQDYEFWVHYVIADRGNQRIVEVIDRFVSDVDGNVFGRVADDEPYNATITYNPGSHVSYNGVVYEAINVTTGNVPTDPVNWKLGTAVPQVGILAWHSPTGFRGGKLDISSMARAYDTQAGPFRANYPGALYIAGLGGTSLSRSDSGIANVPPAGTNNTPVFNSAVAYPINTRVMYEGRLYYARVNTNAGETPDDATKWALLGQGARSAGNGGLVIIDRISGKTVDEIHEVLVPTLGADVFWDPTTSNYFSDAKGHFKKVIGPVTSVTTRAVQIPGHLGARLAIMYTDNTGVYEIFKPISGDPTFDPLDPDRWMIDWMMPSRVYRAIRGTSAAPFSGPKGAPNGNPNAFMPTFARRLSNNDVLLVNGSAGGFSPSNGEFKGEVLIVSGSWDADLFTLPTYNIDVSPPDSSPLGGFSFFKTNLGFGTASIKFVLPTIQNARDIVLPVFADER